MDLFIKKVTFILFFIAPICIHSMPLKKEIDVLLMTPKSSIKTGATNYEKYLPLLKDKKIGLITNQTGILSDKTHLVDFLLEKKINIQTIFAPEHGFRGTADAGEHVVDGKDPKPDFQLFLFMGIIKNQKRNN